VVTSPFLDATRNLIEKDAFGVVVTVIAGPDAGAKAVLDSEGSFIAGSLPDKVEAAARSDAGELMARETSTTLAYGEDELFFEVIAPRPPCSYSERSTLPRSWSSTPACSASTPSWRTHVPHS
jgi:hypothetical protein